MKQSSKIWTGITGALLVALGIICICRPVAALSTAAWLIGLLALIAGISELIFTFRTQLFLPNSGTRMLSSLINIILGILFLSNSAAVGKSLAVIFCFWIIVEGVMVAVRSFDYKRAGFPAWWGMLILGLIALVLGILGMLNPGAAGQTLSALIGIAIILTGLAYFIALCGLNRFEKAINQIF